jgi:3-deoxy-7-phosphoheptulonate synthase
MSTIEELLLSAESSRMGTPVHPDPSNAFSDGPQSVTPQHFVSVVQGVRQIAQAIGRTV